MSNGFSVYVFDCKQKALKAKLVLHQGLLGHSKICNVLHEWANFNILLNESQTLLTRVTLKYSINVTFFVVPGFIFPLRKSFLLTGCVQNFWKAQGGIGGTPPHPPFFQNVGQTLVDNRLTIGKFTAMLSRCNPMRRTLIVEKFF